MLPSLNVPAALRPMVDAGARAALGGVTEIETSVTELTVICVEAVTPSRAALMLAMPGATEVTTPPEAAVAAEELSEAHVTSRVMVCMLASLNVPVAV